MEVSQVQGKYEEEKDEETEYSTRPWTQGTWPSHGKQAGRRTNSIKIKTSFLRTDPLLKESSGPADLLKKGEPRIRETFKSSSDRYFCYILSGHVFSNLHLILNIKITKSKKYEMIVGHILLPNFLSFLLN